MMFAYYGEAIYIILDWFTMWKALEEAIKEQTLSLQLLSGNSILRVSQKTQALLHRTWLILRDSALTPGELSHVCVCSQDFNFGLLQWRKRTDLMLRSVIFIINSVPI